MRTVPLILILSAISLSVAFGQNYQTISANRISYFESQYVKCLRIDSVKHQSDSVFYPFRVIQQVDYGCYTPFVASWIGAQIIVRENGMNLFFNKSNDTIKINTRAAIHDKWIAFNLKDSIIIEATITNHDTMSFLGLDDSVKTISFQVYDKFMSPLDYNINQMNLQISKNYGFLKTFNFYLFPDISVDYPPDQFEELDLVGLSNPRTGLQNLTWYDINDYQPGDEIHILDESTIWFGNFSRYTTTNKAVYKYLDRTEYEDSIVYHYSRRQSIYTDWSDSSSFKYYNDTLKEIIKPDTLFDKLPGEAIESDFELYSFYMANGPVLSKIDRRELEWYTPSGDSCWSMPTIDGCVSADTYLKGLGGPYYSCDSPFSMGGAERKLVYYKKGETEWGIPLTVTGISNTEITHKAIVYPNPAKNHITIKVQDMHTGKLKFYLFDINGRLVLSEFVDSAEKQLNITDVKPGIYFYRLREKGRELFNGKLVISRE